MAEHDDTKWAVCLKFNSRGMGSDQMLVLELHAPGPQEAISEAQTRAVRDPKHGGSIYTTGVTVEEVKSRVLRDDEVDAVVREWLNNCDRSDIHPNEMPFIVREVLYAALDKKVVQ